MLQDEFNARMHELHLNGKREGKYSAPFFAQLLKEHGGLETAKRSSTPPIMLPHSPSRIVEEPKWHPLFTAEET